MSHLKRISIEKSWPLPRKGTKYVLKSYPGQSMSMPLGIILRDILKITSRRKETKALLHGKEVIVNGKINGEEKSPIGLFDVVSIPKLKKNFVMTLNEKGKIYLEEIDDKDSHSKICKVVNMTVLKKGVRQINCLDGRNFISKEKVSINDSVVVGFSNGKISKVITFKSGAEIFVMGGAHMGEKGKITEKDDKIKVSIHGKNFEIQEKNIIVTK